VKEEAANSVRTRNVGAPVTLRSSWHLTREPLGMSSLEARADEERSPQEGSSHGRTSQAGTSGKEKQS
jgi:hypothetical protein